MSFALACTKWSEPQPAASVIEWLNLNTRTFANCGLQWFGRPLFRLPVIAHSCSLRWHLKWLPQTTVAVKEGVKQRTTSNDGSSLLLSWSRPIETSYWRYSQKRKKEKEGKKKKAKRKKKGKRKLGRRRQMDLPVRQLCVCGLCDEWCNESVWLPVFGCSRGEQHINSPSDSSRSKLHFLVSVLLQKVLQPNWSFWRGSCFSGGGSSSSIKSSCKADGGAGVCFL